MLNNKPKTAESLREGVRQQLCEEFEFGVNIKAVKMMEDQIRNGESLHLHRPTNSYSIHLTQLNGVKNIVMYDKKRNCVTDLLHHHILDWWLKKSPDKNKIILERWEDKHA
jgi:hypothetical protein